MAREHDADERGHVQVSADPPMRILLSPPDVGPTERALLLDAFDSNWIAPLGPHVDAFKAELAAAVGARHALRSPPARRRSTLRCCSLGLGGATRSSLTFVASANPITYVGSRAGLRRCRSARLKPRRRPGRGGTGGLEGPGRWLEPVTWPRRPVSRRPTTSTSTSASIAGGATCWPPLGGGSSGSWTTRSLAVGATPSAIGTGSTASLEWPSGRA